MANIPAASTYIGDEPTIPVWWFINGTLVDYSSGYTFAAKLYRADDSTQTTIFTKTTGFVGQLGSGTQQSGTANLLIDMSTTGDLNTAGITAGRHVLQVTATSTSDSTENTFEMYLDLLDRV